MAAGGTVISRLYDFVNGMIVNESHLDTELNHIHLWLNGLLGDTNIAADADIQGAKLKVNTVPTDRVVGGVYTKNEIDVKFTNVNLVGIADRAVAGAKLMLKAITAAEINDGAVGTAQLADDATTAAKLSTTDLAAIKIKLGINKVWRQGHTWAPSGAINVAVGDTDYLNPFFVSLAAGQTAKLAKVRFRINSGTSVTAKLQKNGIDIAGYTALSITTATAEVDAADVDLANNDMISLVVTAINTSPKNMSVTLFIDHYL